MKPARVIDRAGAQSRGSSAELMWCDGGTAARVRDGLLVGLAKRRRVELGKEKDVEFEESVRLE